MVNNYYPKKVKDSSVVMHLVLNDETPVHQNPRRLSPAQRKVVQKIVDDWITESVVQSSSSEYASLIVLTEKKNSNTRLCVNYHRLNKKIVRDRYLLPLMEDQLDRLSETIVYCMLNLKDGIFHLPVDKESRRYTSFMTPNGQFEFLKALFGLYNSQAVFQRHIKAVFRELTTKDIILIYFNDLIIPATKEMECLLENWNRC